MSSGITGLARPGGEEVTVIRPPGRMPSLGLVELWRYRAISLVLARRSLMVRYRQTVIGAGWTLIQPLAMMAVLSVFFGLLVRFPSEGIPYPVFVYIGLLVFQFVAKILNEGSLSVSANTDLIHKIYFPRISLPVSISLAALVDLGFSLVALLVLLVAFGIVPGLNVALLPLMLLLVLATALGVTFWLAALNARYRDVAQLLPFLTQLWMFLSPIIYPSSILPPEFRTLYWLNPLAVGIDGIRWALTGTPLPPPEAWLLGSGIAAALLVSGYVYFRRQEPAFSDVV